MFEPAFAPAGVLYSLVEPERPPTPLSFPSAGLVLARCQRGRVERGEMLAMITADAAD